MGAGQILRDFSGWTSAHGIPHIGSAQNLCLRLFWTIIFLCSTGMFIFQMILLIQKYLAYDVTVQTELKFEERYFPAVTVCNLNPYKSTQIYLAPQMEMLMANYTQAIASNVLQTDPNDYWGFAKLNDTIAIQSRARDHLMYLASDLKKNNPLAINFTTYDKDEFIMNCAYNTKPCDMTADFEKLIDPIYGACYTFNNQNPPTYKSTRAGPLYGLRLLLKSNQTEYLPITESAGVRVSVHGQNEEPFPDAFGYNAAAGFTTSFGIKFIRTTRLPSPYGNCTDDKGYRSFYYDGTYAVEGCFRSCFQEHVHDECKCYDPRFGSPNTDYCGTKDIDCVSKFSSYQSGSTNFNAITSCSCPQPCNESTYGVTVSTALWPSDVYKPPECKQSSTSWLNEADCQDWYSENTMLIEVYYERMNYQLLSESEAYGIVNLVSDMGGQLGLWMGISVITVVEFFSLIVLLCLYCVARRKESGMEEDDDEEDSDEEDEEHDEKGGSPPPPYADNDREFSAPPPPR